MKKNKSGLLAIFIVIAVVAVIALGYFMNALTVEKVTTSKFFELAGITLVEDDEGNIKYEYLEEKEIVKVVFDSYNVSGYVKLSNGKYALRYESS